MRIVKNEKCKNINSKELIMKKCKNNGFTILELVIAVAIISIIFAGIMVGIHFGTRSVGVNRHRSEAIIIAQRKLEEYKTLDYSAISSQAYASNGVLGETKVDVSNVYNGTDVIGKNITVTVRWSDYGNVYTESVSTFIRDPNY